MLSNFNTFVSVEFEELNIIKELEHCYIVVFWNSAFWWTGTLNPALKCKRKRSSVSIRTKNGEWEFIPGPPSAAACFPAPVNVRSSSLWQLADSPVLAPRIHPGCHESNKGRARYKANVAFLLNTLYSHMQFIGNKKNKQKTLNFNPIYCLEMYLYVSLKVSFQRGLLYTLL